MATKSPSSAPMFATLDSIMAERWQDTGSDMIVKAPGANQFLGQQAAHHDGQSTLAPGGNKVQAGQVPRTMGPMVGRPTKAQPIGASTTTLQG